MHGGMRRGGHHQMRTRSLGDVLGLSAGASVGSTLSLVVEVDHGWEARGRGAEARAGGLPGASGPI